MVSNRVIANVILGLAVIGSMVLAIYLFFQGRNVSGTGWVIMCGLYVFFLYLVNMRRDGRLHFRDRKATRSMVKKPRQKNTFVEVIATKDPVLISAAKDALADTGVFCTVLDENSNTLFSFLPDVEMRIMVPSSDEERSLTILNSLFESRGKVNGSE